MNDKNPLPTWSNFWESLLDLNVMSIPVWRLVLAGLVLVLGVAMRRFLLERLARPLRKLLERTETDVDDRFLRAVKHPLGWLINLVAVYFGLLLLNLPEELMRVAVLILQTVGTVMAAWMVHKVITLAMAVLGEYALETESDIDDHLVPIVGRVLRVALIGLVVVLIIQQWGYDATSLLAGLGLGGLAFALAAKPTLSNWFGSVMIFTDRPFTMGDRIEVDSGSGVVEEVGLRSTRIRTREDSLISIPNADIASKPIENLSARRRRRITTTLGLVYATSADQLRDVLQRIRGMLEEHPEIDHSHLIVRFNGFGDSSLDIFVETYARVTGRGDYYRVAEDVYLAMMDEVEAAGTAFAFPSRSLYFENAPEDRREWPGGRD